MRSVARLVLVLVLVEAALWVVHFALVWWLAGRPLAAAMLTGALNGTLLAGAALVLVRVTAIVLFPMLACAVVVHRLVSSHR